MRSGRKVKPGVKRTASGQPSRAGQRDEIHPETLAVRERELKKDGIMLSFPKLEGGREVVKKTAGDRLSGYTLGRLLLRYRQDKSNPGSISQEQFDAGEAWASLLVARKALDDSHKLSAKTPSFIMVGGSGSSREIDQDRINRIRNRWAACQAVLDEACTHHGWKLRQVLIGVCVENWPIDQITEQDFGLLRTGLNELGRLLR